MVPIAESYRRVYCNPTRSFDGRGSFHDLGDQETVALHLVADENEEINNEEEQGFEAVLDVDHFGRILRNATTMDSADFGESECQLFQREKLQSILKDKSLNGPARRDSVFKMLESRGIKTFIVVSGPDDDAMEIVQRIRDVIHFVSRLKRSHKQPTLKACLLFQDMDGLLYNLTLPKHVEGAFSRWQASLNTFSGTQALGAIAILSRSFPCFAQSGDIQVGNPAILGLMLGLALTEELSLSWLNSSILIQGIPSTSAFTLVNGGSADWISKVTIGCLILAGAAHGKTQKCLTIVGISLACVALLANMGARVWHFLKWRPFAYSGMLGSIVAYSLAILTGLLFPHLANRDIEAGGKAAVETAVKNIFWVGSLFLLSDHDGFQKFLLVGTEDCDQHIVNIAIGAWLGCTLLLNLIAAVKITQKSRWTDDDNSLLCEDCNSPVGFTVPNFPAFVIDPSEAKKGISFISLENELYLSIVVAILIMASIVSMPYTGWSNGLQEHITNLLQHLQ